MKVIRNRQLERETLHVALFIALAALATEMENLRGRMRYQRVTLTSCGCSRLMAFCSS